VTRDRSFLVVPLVVVGFTGIVLPPSLLRASFGTGLGRSVFVVVLRVLTRLALTCPFFLS
jgi:hypothetical protein